MGDGQIALQRACGSWAWRKEPYMHLSKSQRAATTPRASETKQKSIAPIPKLLCPKEDGGIRDGRGGVLRWVRRVYVCRGGMVDGEQWMIRW
jgi:hypothetical protein